MEIYNVGTGQIKEHNADWNRHSFGMFERGEGEFLENFADGINYAISQQLQLEAEKASRFEDGMEYVRWLNERAKQSFCEMVNTKTGCLIAVRKWGCYQTENGWIFTNPDNLKTAIAEAVTEAINRNEVVDEKEKNAALWALKKMGIEAEWRQGIDMEEWRE